MPRLVPPTAVTQGLEAGQSVVANPKELDSSPLSPEEKYTPMPSIAACISVSSTGFT
jgi:hypothetical protein